MNTGKSTASAVRFSTVSGAVAKAVAKAAALASAMIALSACAQFSSEANERQADQVSASQLVAPPAEGPQLFGPWDDQAQPTNSSRASRNGDSARVARTRGAIAALPPEPSRVVVQRQRQAPILQSPPQIAAASPPQPLIGRTGIPAFEQGFTETASGLKYKQTQVGQGPVPRRGDTIIARYSGWIYEDGEKGDLFDRSGDRPFTFQLGAGRVIEGWDEAFAGMRPGEKRTLIVPSELAYGRTGAPGLIRPNEDLVFDVELVEVQ